MSDIRFNQWLHNSGTGGVSQVDGGHVGIGTTNPLIPVGAGVTAVLNVGVVTANYYYGDGSNLSGIVGAGTSLSFNDNIGAYFGNSQDLKIYHDGNHSYIDDQGTGNLRLRSGTLEILNLAGNKTSAIFSSGGAQTLNFNNNTKFVTTNTGIDVTGSVVADDLVITGPSVVADLKSTNNNYVLGLAGNNASDKVYLGTTSGNDFILANTSSVTERLRITSDGQLGLNNTSPDSWNTQYTTLQIHDAAVFYGSQDDSFVSLGANHYLNSGGNFIYSNSDFASRFYQVNGGFHFESASSGSAGGAFTFTERLRITSSGHVLPGADNAYYLGSSSVRWAEVNTHKLFAGLPSTNGSVANFKGGTYNQINIAHMNNSSWGLLLTNSDSTSNGGYHQSTSGNNNSCGVINVNNDALYLGTNNTARWRVEHDGHFIPFSGGSFDIGSTGRRVRRLYASNSTSTSDRNEKNTITESDLGLDFICKLKPVSYKWNQKEGEDLDTKTHYGLISQDVEEVIIETGKTIDDFGAIDKPDGDPMGLSYNEFVSPLVKAIQDLKSEINTLQQENQALRIRVTNLEDK